ncbi:serine/threonine protein kinase [Pendulispora albinea]|uniref:Serine/threonine protein kinase n=1 Tax=Pendulispora albinea TaxID=2741071 RepID=A0ABZ2LXI7_9BACT
MEPRLKLGRYLLYCELAAGGMATVYLGRSVGAAGFGRTVAIKRLHPHLAKDPKLVKGFVDEARLVARVHHPNVVQTLDVVAQDGEIFLVLEYVKGESLGRLIGAASRENVQIPVPVALSIITGVLNGLHAAHEATDERGVPLSMVHRDISPQNILVGVDGTARVCDFGVAKAANRLLGTTRDGQLKGKLPYMAPEQVGGDVSRRTDLYATGVVLWEMLTCYRLFKDDNEMQLLQAILTSNIQPPSVLNPNVPPAVDRIVMKALAGDPRKRYATAHEMAVDIDAYAEVVASPMKVGQWVLGMARAAIASRNGLVAEIESSVDRSVPHEMLALGSSGVHLEAPGVHLEAAGVRRDAAGVPLDAAGVPLDAAGVRRDAAGVHLGDSEPAPAMSPAAEPSSIASVPSLAVRLPARSMAPGSRSVPLWLALSAGALISVVGIVSFVIFQRTSEPSAPKPPEPIVEPSAAPSSTQAEPPPRPPVVPSSSPASPASSSSAAPAPTPSAKTKPTRAKAPAASPPVDKSHPTPGSELAPSQKW